LFFGGAAIATGVPSNAGVATAIDAWNCLGTALALIYNDTEKERDKLAVSISSENGKSWQWKRHLENTLKERFDYPSIIQSKDGSLQVTYSYNLKTIKHACFDEAWVQEGEGK